MLLFFDTETTGLPDYSLSVEHESQPQLVQLAAQLCEPDGKLRATLSLIVEPDWWEIPEEVARIHGITKPIAIRCGLPLSIVCDAFVALCSQATGFVAHNIQFDEWVMAAAAYRAGKPNPFMSPEKPRICTQQAARPVLNIAPTHAMMAGNRKEAKAPSLRECVEHFYGAWEQKHDGLADVRACRMVYAALRRAGAV